MVRTSLRVAGCLLLGGCVTNTQSTQNAQLVPVGGAPVAARVVAAPPPRPVVVQTPTARLAQARLVTTGKTTTSGATLLLASPQALARDCAPLGSVEVKVTEPPEHGSVHVEQGMAFPNYVPGDPPYLCNAHRAPATLVTYRSEPGFTGQDVTVVQIFFPDGQAPTVRFNIAVR